MADVHARRYGRLPRRSDDSGRSLTEAELYAKLAPGLHIAVRYEDEPSLMMERRLLWAAGDEDPGIWAVMTPDNDVYTECLFAENPEEGPDKVVHLGDSCGAPRPMDRSVQSLQ